MQTKECKSCRLLRLESHIPQYSNARDDIESYSKVSTNSDASLRREIANDHTRNAPPSHRCHLAD
jgi:hypothetical protein